MLLYGQYLIKPWLGAAGYSDLAEASAFAHMAFMIGVLIMAVLWLRQNLPSAIDWQWLKRGSGFLSDQGDNPPARRFNAGQKLIFWAVMLGGGLLIVSGVGLMLPFFLGLDIQAMQWLQIAHAAFGLIMVAVIIGHIYIGTIGMEGAFDAMRSGRWIATGPRSITVCGCGSSSARAAPRRWESRRAAVVSRTRCRANEGVSSPGQ